MLKNKLKIILPLAVSGALLFSCSFTAAAANISVQQQDNISSISQNAESSYVVAGMSFLSTNLVRKGDGTATFKYKIVNTAGEDITSLVPASDLIVTISTSLSAGSVTTTLDPKSGVGTVSYGSTEPQGTIIIAMVYQPNGRTVVGTFNLSDTDTPPAQSSISKISITSKNLVKSGKNTATFNYSIINKDGVNITKSVPASQLVVTATVNSKAATATLDPAKGTGTIKYKFTKTSKTASITIVDTLTGVPGKATLKIK